MNLPDMAQMQQMLSQAQTMQSEMDARLAATVVEASTGGGMVTVRMTGKKEVLRIRIEPTALGASAGDLELLEDLIAAAVNQASQKADALAQSSMAGMMGGLGLPGLG